MKVSATGRKLTGFAVWALVCLTMAARGQQAAGNRVMGTVALVSGNAVTVRTDAGATVNVTVPDTARILKTSPGQKTLAGATKIGVSDIAAGDRVLMVVAGDPATASIVVVNKASDIAAMQQKEQEDWQRRGVGGLVKSVDPASGTLVITQGTRTITIHTSSSTAYRRYAPDSVKFSDAQPSTLAAIQPGDQVQARGDKNADGSEVTAEEIVSGSFRNIAGVVVATDAAAGTFTVKDLVTRKTVTIKTTPDSDMRKIDPQIAQMIAVRLRAGTSGQRGTGAPSAGNEGAAAGEHAGQWRQSGGGAGGPGGGLARVLQRSPEIHVADLHKGDAVMIVATSGNPDAATAIRLVAGVEPMLAASASASQSMFSSAWSLGGGNGGAGDEGGESNP